MEEALNQGLRIPKKQGANPVALFSCLLSSVMQVHIMHLQAKTLASHLALGTYYEEMPGLVDGLIEGYQGKYGIVTGYTVKPLVTTAPNEYLRGLHKEVELGRAAFTDSDLLNTLDEIKMLLKTTIYKLENLA